ncbi:hypothetical protein Hanom_Chr01g00043321 [Helianthus anomalus]
MINLEPQVRCRLTMLGKVLNNQLGVAIGARVMLQLELPDDSELRGPIFSCQSLSS